jgi:hypothetical protein
MISEGEERETYRDVLHWWDTMLGEPSVPVQDDHLNEQKKHLRTQLREHSSTVEALWRRYDSESPLRNYASAGSYGGIVISIVGFLLWYILAQRHQEKLVRLQVEKERRA